MIDQIVDVEVAELVRFYGSIVGTEGISKEIQKLCNDNIQVLLDAIQPKIAKVTAKSAGIIT